MSPPQPKVLVGLSAKYSALRAMIDNYKYCPVIRDALVQNIASLSKTVFDDMTDLKVWFQRYCHHDLTQLVASQLPTDTFQPTDPEAPYEFLDPMDQYLYEHDQQFKRIEMEGYLELGLFYHKHAESFLELVQRKHAHGPEMYALFSDYCDQNDIQGDEGRKEFWGFVSNLL